VNRENPCEMDWGFTDERCCCDEPDCDEPPVWDIPPRPEFIEEP
jgi:hypothetical protein